MNKPTVNEDAQIENRQMLGTQSNHGTWILPKNISHLNSPTLWLAVAWWGLLKGKAVSRNDISEAFCITQRRAGDVLYYLARNCKDMVVCAWEPTRKNGRSNTNSKHVSLYIEAVHTKSRTIKKIKKNVENISNKKLNKERKAEMDAILKDFLTRKIVR